MEIVRELSPHDLFVQIAADNPDFRSVPTDTLDALVSSGQLRCNKRGTTIYRRGEDWQHLGFLADGSIGMIARAEGAREHLYEHVRPGAFFGVAAVLDGETEMADAIVLSKEATYVLFPCDTVAGLCRSDASLSLALAAIVTRRLRHVTELLAEQINLSVDERLARFLLKFAVESGMAPAMEPLPRMTQAQIASAAGTVKEVAARVIARLESGNALRRESGHIRYVNREKLIEYAF